MADKTTPRAFVLKDVLAKLGVSQRKLAKWLEATQDWVSRIHNGKNLPSWPTACRIAEVLGVSIGVFMPEDPAWRTFFTTATPSTPYPGPDARKAPAATPKKRKEKAHA